ncbi:MULTISPECIES: type I secretion system permease/ATPase [Halomonadaceae]|uniref:Type I secretion system permease/ATPase n=2 Tax=Halomonadaceae TaxID=28256 RepID=A0ABS6ZI67_9GAMM|nr:MULTISPECIES: type I secretion system permease/ATPase [Halomonas]MBW6389757.1 type I secretion system permease/ATPase [Halomonas antri]QTP60067.1 type I secretion system permease/ATPase [Halomonas sulfidivorans]
MVRIPQASELHHALHSCRGSFASVGLFSLFVNLLMLVPAIYMLQVYDRVLTTLSGETLLMLTLVVVFLFLIMGLLELVRSRILVRIGNRLDLQLSGRLCQAMFRHSLLTGSRQSAQPLTDLATLRQFLAGNGLLVFFDAPWVPVYLAVLFLFHPWLGLFATLSGLVLLTLTAVGEKLTQPLLSGAAIEQIKANELVDANLRNAEALHAMGMLPGILARWSQRHRRYLAGQSRASDRGEALASSARVLRLLAQSLILGLGAWLVLREELTPGMMIAGSIVMGRALAPIDRMIGTWRGFISARGAYRRLEELLLRVPMEPERMPLPRPSGRLRLEGVTASVPGGRVAVLSNIHFELGPGEHLGIIGPSAAGKSSLARVMLGIWPVSAGTVRLDGADIASWQRDALGPCIGYLPQDIELFDGTIAENIARFGEVDSIRVVAAARKAGVHEMILALPDGYDTLIASGSGLSGGQRQRLALARALYGDPVLVVLDEPNANLDDRGEKALAAAMSALKQEGVTLCVISHRISVLKGMDRLLLLRDGEMQRFGRREEVMASLTIKPVPSAAAEAQPRQAAPPVERRR